MRRIGPMRRMTGSIKLARLSQLSEVLIKSHTGEDPSIFRLVKVEVPNKRHGVEFQHVRKFDDAFAKRSVFDILITEYIGRFDAFAKVLSHVLQFLGLGASKRGAFEQTLECFV